MQTEHFFAHLADSRLLADDQVRAVRERLGETPPDQLKQALVDEGVLTPFQLRRLWAGESKGLVLGQYHVLDELGRGGFGWVYKARHTLMNREVALKVILPELVEDKRARAWFRREVLAMTQLQHPNIVLAYDANEVDDILFLAMEFVDGPNLHTFVVEQGPLPIGLACAMMYQAARALHYAHEKGMVHRDIKPANLLLPRGHIGTGHGAFASQPLDVFLPAPAAFPNTPLIKIVDFGLARLHGQCTGTSLTLDKVKGFLGTPDYVSPEQARDVHDADIRADLYSLGCTFYFALTGERPFRGQTPLEIIVQHLEKDPIPLEDFRPEIPPALASIIRRLMAKRREQRFQTPTDLIAELNFLFGSGPLGGFGRDSGALRIPEQDRAATAPRLPQHALPRPTSGPAKPDMDTGLARTAVLSLPPTPVEVLVAALRQQPEPSFSGPAVHHAEDRPAADPLPALPEPSLPREPAAESAAALPEKIAPGNSFCQHWRRWTAVVEIVLQEGRANVAEADYRALYVRLLESAGTEAESRGDRGAALFRRLAAAVAPWVSPRSLESADAEILVSLHERCLELDRELGLDRGGRRFGLWPIVFVCFFAAACLAGHLVFAQGLRLPSDWSLPSLSRYLLANPLLPLGLLVPLSVVGWAFAFGRRPRNN